MSSTDWILGLVVFPLAGYLAGSIPFGFLAGRVRGVDLRKAGSGNIGATNAGRVLGKKWGIGVFILDVLKGVAPVLAVGLWLPRETVRTIAASDGVAATVAFVEVPAQLGLSLWLLTAFAVIAGHVWPVWLRFKGGKWVATSLGVVLAIYPFFTWPGLIALAAWVGVVLASRYVSLASIVAAIAFPVSLLTMSLAIGQEWAPARIWPLLVFAAVMAALVVWRHRSNVARLLKGTESRIGQPNKSVDENVRG